jgi:hypothetical protein
MNASCLAWVGNWNSFMLCVVIYIMAILFFVCGLNALYISFSYRASDSMCGWFVRIHMAQAPKYNS